MAESISDVVSIRFLLFWKLGYKDTDVEEDGTLCRLI